MKGGRSIVKVYGMTSDTDESHSWSCREVVNSTGVHARPAAWIVKTARLFQAEVVLSAPDSFIVDGKIIQSENWRSVEATSIMGLLSLNLENGVVVRIRARGPDAEEVLDALEVLFRSRFYEE